MRRRRTLAVGLMLAAAGLAGVPGPVPGLGARPAGAAYFGDIGGDDTLVVLTPWETAWLAHALDNGSQWHCAPPGIRVPRVVKFFNRFCSGYNQYNRVAYWRAKVFLKAAVRYGGCGAFVIDGASWRPTRIRAAEGWSPASNSAMAHVSYPVGQTKWFKTSSGWTNIRCSEYRFPSRQSNILPRQVITSPGGA